MPGHQDSAAPRGQAPDPQNAERPQGFPQGLNALASLSITFSAVALNASPFLIAP